MSETAARDENFIPTLLGASSVDGKSPIKVYADPATHRLLVNATAGVVGPLSSTDNAIATFNGTLGLTIQSSQASIGSTGTIITYGNIATAGYGVPAIYAYGRATAQTGTVASVTTYTVGASDASFLISGNVMVTAYAAGNFNFQVVYTTESNTLQTVNMQGHFVSGYATAISGAGAFEVQPIHIRALAGTTITIKTAGHLRILPTISKE